MKLKGYGRTCRRGHKVEGENVVLGSDGSLGCRSCKLLRSRIYVAPEDGVHCRICGAVLRTLGRHLQAHHGMNASEYRKQFPGAPTTGSLLRSIRRDHWDDRVRAGTAWDPKRRPRVCAKGHRLTAKNSITESSGRRRCRRCKNERQRKWYERNREKMSVYRRERYEANREEEISRKREYRERNREKVNASSRKGYEAHREERIAGIRKYREENRKQINESRRERRRLKREALGPENLTQT